MPHSRLTRGGPRVLGESSTDFAHRIGALSIDGDVRFSRLSQNIDLIVTVLIDIYTLLVRGS